MNPDFTSTLLQLQFSFVGFYLEWIFRFLVSNRQKDSMDSFTGILRSGAGGKCEGGGMKAKTMIRFPFRLFVILPTTDFRKTYDTR